MALPRNSYPTSPTKSPVINCPQINPRHSRFITMPLSSPRWDRPLTRHLVYRPPLRRTRTYITITPKPLQATIRYTYLTRGIRSRFWSSFFVVKLRAILKVQVLPYYVITSTTFLNSVIWERRHLSFPKIRTVFTPSKFAPFLFSKTSANPSRGK